jgi:ABC-2 type transport system ATP-binding protein
VATYRALKAQGTPVKLMWQLGGHSGRSAKGELDWKEPLEGTYQARTFTAWLDHYLKGKPAAPALDFTYFRDWVKYTGDATPAYGRAAGYPVGGTRELYLSGSNALVGGLGDVVAGAASLLTTAAGLPTSYTELSALDQSNPLWDAPGTFARFESAPLDADTDVVGVPSVDVRVSAPLQQFTGQAGGLGELVLFFKLYDVAPDGGQTLVHRLISPVRISMPDVPVQVELPGIVHRFAKGHRFALLVSGGDAAYRAGNVPGPISILTDTARPSVLHLPVAAASDQEAVVEASAAARACTGRSSLAVRVPRALRSRARSVVVLVNGKRVATLRGKRIARRVNVKRVRSGSTVVRLVVRTKTGKTVTRTRRYPTCA